MSEWSSSTNDPLIFQSYTAANIASLTFRKSCSGDALASFSGAAVEQAQQR